MPSMATEAVLDRNRRQIWAEPTTTTVPSNCMPFTLPSNGVLSFDQTNIITLTRNAVFQPQCTGDASFRPDLGSSVLDLRDPFYASLSPQIYAVASATVVSYMLFIMLVITPRTFFVGGVGGGGTSFLGRRGMISGGTGRTSVVGVGGRPWLQKAATLTVAISLTIATVNTFRVAKEQYDQGFEDAVALRDEVVGSLEIRIVRIISDTLLWLAQVQTLIRLFPRHKEKVVIEWVGFGLISLDTIFSIVNSFVDKSPRTRPRTFQSAIPALTYLFELALSLLYAAWVIYYSLEKRRFAYFHVKMKNICLVALLSLAAVLIPVVFFVLDVSKPTVIGWADYVRWVGATAASVVVWEWVERIEALQRDELKEGILGREIFDGDEMLEVTPSSEVNWPAERRDHVSNNGGLGNTNRTGQPAIGDVRKHAMRSRLLPRNTISGVNGDIGAATSGRAVSHTSNLLHPTPPPPIASPVSRTDTTSAVSTVYAVHYHSISASPTPEEPTSNLPQANDHLGAVQTNVERPEEVNSTHPPTCNTDPATGLVPHWRTITNHFKRRRALPPQEITHATQNMEAGPAPPADSQFPSASGQESRGLLSRLRPGKNHHVLGAPLPYVVIPAQPRGSGRVWSPMMQNGGKEGESELLRQPDPRDDPACYAPQDTESSRTSGTWIGPSNISRLQSIPERQQDTRMTSDCGQADKSIYSEEPSLPTQVGRSSIPESCRTVVDHLNPYRSNASNPAVQENSWSDINLDPPRPP